MSERERWGSRLGLIMAAAGSAVGIGNLLRFPAQAGQNGGGAFMIPYFMCLLFFGLPMMWVAWTIGRYGGQFGHTSTPGMFDKMWKSPFAKYFGVIGLSLPLVFCLYYTYIEAWCLGYAYFALTGKLVSTPGNYVDLGTFYNEFLGNTSTHTYFPGYTTALVFTIITILLNIWVLYRGVAKGIELLAKIAMPLLLLFCLILSVRVFTLSGPGLLGSVWDGLNFLYTPDFSRLASPGIWIAAAGQIFFTLSIGFGSMECYSAYLREHDDIALAGLTTAATNEFVEVIFGSAIAIPAAAIYFGPERIVEIARSGTFAIGMISMPEILRNLPGLAVFGAIWFLLLFFAAYTSSVAVAQPVVAFLQDEAKLLRGAAAALVGVFWIVGTLPVVYFYKYGVFDEMDRWAGTYGLVFFSAVEAVMFAWIFGIDRGWTEMHKGAQIRVPRPFYYVIKYITPAALVTVFCWWFFDAIRTNELIPTPRLDWAVAERNRFEGDFLTNAPPADSPEAQELAEIRGRMSAAIELASRDLSAMADVTLGSDGTVTVKTFEADPALRRSFTATDLQRFLELQSFRFKPLNGAVAPASLDLSIPIEGLHRTPFIWLARVMIALYTITFLIITRTLWQARKHRTA